MIAARFRGGPRDGKEMELEEAPLELLVHVPGGKPVRYVLGHVDKRGMRHYYVPADVPPKKK